MGEYSINYITSSRGRKEKESSRWHQKVELNKEKTSFDLTTGSMAELNTTAHVSGYVLASLMFHHFNRNSDVVSKRKRTKNQGKELTHIHVFFVLICKQEVNKTDLQV